MNGLNQNGMEGTPEELVRVIQTETMEKLTQVMANVELSFQSRVRDIEDRTRDYVHRLIIQARDCGIEGAELVRFFETEFRGTIGVDFDKTYEPLARRFQQTLEAMKVSNADANK